ncbi:MAG: DUF4186 domain-containing protein [Bacilli bacterium]|nr:DUF4186 domain-containing protein [Bacilli bacterium]
MKLNEKQEQYIRLKLIEFKHSKFRSSFHLRKYMIPYIEEKGFDTIESHAYDFIRKSLIVDHPKEGKQTPMKGHPVFIAQHACGCCCRGCLEKWHRIPKNRDLEEKEIHYLVALVLEWIKQEYRELKKG